LKHCAAGPERKLREREAELTHAVRVNVGGRPVAVEMAPDNPDAAIDGTVFLVSVWLGEMLDAGEINAGEFNAMVRELYTWANAARGRTVQ
jgi:hypothetical protein